MNKKKNLHHPVMVLYGKHAELAVGGLGEPGRMERSGRFLEEDFSLKSA
jgi:hypothetical protein